MFKLSFVFIPLFIFINILKYVIEAFKSDGHVYKVPLSDFSERRPHLDQVFEFCDCH